jgi:hypothetical protein
MNTNYAVNNSKRVPFLENNNIGNESRLKLSLLRQFDKLDKYDDDDVFNNNMVGGNYNDDTHMEKYWKEKARKYYYKSRDTVKTLKQLNIPYPEKFNKYLESFE